MKARFLSVALALPALLGACSASPSSGDPLSPHLMANAPVETGPALTVTATQGKDAFAVDMFRSVVAEQKGNVVFSPASLENALDVLASGARGDTLKALQTLPRGARCVRSAMRVESADALFVADDMKLKPVKVGDVYRVSFANAASAASAVNKWCNDKTHGLIPSIVGPASFSGDTRMVIVNAVYLKEKWLKPFDKADTDARGRFHTADGKTVTTPMMRRTDDFRYAEGEDWQAVALYYDASGRPGEPGCFIGILPKGDARAFASTLTPQKYEAIRKALRRAPLEETCVTLPKMEVDTPAFPLNNALCKNGLGCIFQHAELSGFTDEPDLRVSSVVQRCHVIVDEEKTEAAAVTGIIADCFSIGMEKQPRVITFDRPFIWAIDDLTTGSAPFFMGLFEQP